MNIKRFILAAIALFVFVFFYEWLVHGFLFTGLYEQSASVWRPMAQMMANMPLMIGIQIVLSIWLAFVFTQLFKTGGVVNGLFFGLYFGVFAGIMSGAWYGWLPVPALLGWAWFISGIVEGVLGGLILGAIYRKKTGR